MAITINSNIASLRAQRSFARNAQGVAQTITRLSSGQRINRASDDSAGLAIASQLNLSSRVYSQGIRNLSDGLSALNIADSSLHELSGLLIRLNELAIQSANGTYSTTQRGALHIEGKALVAEYNRVVASTDFNGLNILRSSQSPLTLQAGFGGANSLDVSLGQQLSRNVGTGSYQSPVSHALGVDPDHAVAQDFNNDGNLDLVVANANQVSLLVGNGSGGFAAATNYAVGGNPRTPVAGDFNHDGYIDLAVSNSSLNGADPVLSILLNDRAGGFNAATQIIVGAPAMGGPGLVTSDFNGDGHLDLGYAANAADAIEILSGDGAGGFSITSSIAVGGPTRLSLADFDLDGISDLVARDSTSNQIRVFRNNGSGSFSNTTNLNVTTTGAMAVGDFNSDGRSDIVNTNTGSTTVQIFLANASGGFDGPVTHTVGALTSVIEVGDINGDGFVDIVSSSATSNSISILTGIGDGTFNSAISVTSNSALGLLLADFNEDNVLDIASTDNAGGGINVLLANTQSTTSMAYLNLSSRATALQALSTIEETFNRISRERNSIGAHQSRVATAVQNLYALRENSNAAASRIVDADIAQESADLTRYQILARVNLSVLAQANVQPNIAVLLLGN